MIGILLCVVLLVVLVAFAIDAYAIAKAKEEDDREEAARIASMDAAMTDERGRCWACLNEGHVFELVDTGRRYALLCHACAAITRNLKTQMRGGRT